MNSYLSSLFLSLKMVPAVLQEGGEVDPIVPVRGEVFNLAIRQHGLQHNVIIIR